MTEHTDVHGYEGERLRERRHGRGVHTLNGRVIYDGEWRDDIHHGLGTRTTHTDQGDRIIMVKFNMGNPHGSAFELIGDQVIRRTWVEGIPSQSGTIIYADGGSYTGDMDEGGRRHGCGTYINGVTGEKNEVYMKHVLCVLVALPLTTLRWFS
jgi:hypothetical protein